MIRRPPRSTQSRSSAASDVYKRQSVHRHPAMFRHGNDAVGLDVGMLLVPDPILALDDLVRPREPGIDAALVDADRLEDLRRLQGIEYRLGRLVLDVHLRRQQSLPILVLIAHED